MKTLYLISGIGPPAGWGTEFIQNLIFPFARKGIKATVLTPIYVHTHPDWKKWVRQQKQTHGVRIIPLEVPNFIKKSFLFHLYLTPLLVTISAIKLMRKEKFDLVHEFSSIPFILFRSLIFKVLCNITTVFTLGVYNTTLFGNMVWFKFFDFARYYFIPSHKLIDKIVSLGVDKNKIIFSPPGIDFKPFRKKIDKLEAQENLGLPTNKFIFSFFGPLTQEKGVGDIIEASKMIKTSLTKKMLIVLYTIWKGSNEHSKLKTRIKSLNLPHLKLVEKYVNIPILLAASDAILLPQQTGFGTTIPPISVIECLLAKKFVITTDILGTNEWVNNSNGRLLKPKDPRLLAKAMEEIEEIYNQKNIQPLENTKNLEDFKLENSVLLYLSIYSSLK